MKFIEILNSVLPSPLQKNQAATRKPRSKEKLRLDPLSVTSIYFNVTETKPSLINQQCVVYEFKCNWYDTNYIGCMNRYLHIEELKYW